MRFSYLENLLYVRPCKLTYIGKHGEYKMITSSRRMLDETYTRLCAILKFKIRPKVYIRANMMTILPDVPRYSEGIHIARPLRSVLYVTHTEALKAMLFTLVHEMYHEYQYRNKKSFNGITLEEREIQADGFAVAYCEMLGLESGVRNSNVYIPEKVSHIFFSEDTLKNTDSSGIPEKVRIYAEYCKEKFNLYPQIWD